MGDTLGVPFYLLPSAPVPMHQPFHSFTGTKECPVPLLSTEGRCQASCPGWTGELGRWAVGIGVPGLGTTREVKNRDPTEDMFGDSLLLGLWLGHKAEVGPFLLVARLPMAGSFAPEAPSG